MFLPIFIAQPLSTASLAAYNKKYYYCTIWATYIIMTEYWLLSHNFSLLVEKHKCLNDDKYLA